MLDRDKILTWLEICGKDRNCSGTCPYSEHGFGEYGDCREQLMEDAFDLLKEDCHNCKLECLLQKYDELKEKYDALLKEQEAKQGKWERQYSRPGVFENLFWWCSVCGQPTGYNDAGIFYQYCPHCGAKLEPCKEGR